MAPKGDSNKVKDGTVTVNIDDFTRTRDSVSFLLFFSLLSAFLLARAPGFRRARSG